MNKKHLFVLVFFLVGVIKNAKAQIIYQPYSYQFYQKLNTSEYSTDTRLHTSLRPFLLSDSNSVKAVYDSLTMANIDNTGKSWLHKIFFSGHVAEQKTKKYTFYVDYLTDVQEGREYFQKKTTWLNTRGFQFGATIGKNIFIYTSAYENQGKFANYLTTYIDNVKVIPSEIPVNILPFDAGSIDWAYVTSLIGYTPNKNITITLGQDKIFIGDGYRSLLLSDNAPVYPLLRFTINLSKNLQYSAIWAYLEDQNAPTFNSFNNNRRKWAAFHYIDWNINNRASLGFFNALIAEEADNQGNLHGFDLNYLNPVFFASGLGPSGSVSDNALFGFTAKYKILNKTTVYGQLLFDQSSPANGNGTAYAWQLGTRGSDLFSIKSLNYIFEFNTASPSAYYGQNSIVNYTQYNEPLADPFGANFKEILGIVNYSAGRFDFQFEGVYGKLKENLGYTNYGNDIVQLNYLNLSQVVGTTSVNSPTTVKYGEGTVAFVLNPKYNFRIELGGLFRQEKSNTADTKTALITIGLKSSFRNLYHDF